MRQISSVIIFITIVLTISFALNYYVMARLAGLFAIKRNWIFWAVLAICTISLIAASILQAYSDDVFSRSFYVLAANWVGVLWLLFCTVLTYEVLKFFIKIQPRTAGLTIIAIVVTATVYSAINARLIRIKRITIPARFDMDIVQISDVHIGSTSPQLLKTIVEKINSLDPDLVVITGDLMDNLNGRTSKALKSLDNLKAQVFLVTGNHEGYIGLDKVAKALSDTKVKLLRNESVEFGQIRIIGIDDDNYGGNLDWLLNELNTDDSKFSLLLFHRPTGLKAASAAGIDLVLSGHTHRGQIFPFHFFVRPFYKYMAGLYKHNDTHLYVTPGTGTWGPRMRLGSQSEIVLVQLRTE